MEVTPLEKIRKRAGVTPTEVLENDVLVKKDIPDSAEVIAEYVASTVNMLRNCPHSEVVNKRLSGEDYKFSTATELILLLDPLPEPEKKESIGMVLRKLSKVYEGKLGQKPDKIARFDTTSKSREPPRVKLDGLFLGHEKVYQLDEHGKIRTDARGNKIKEGYGYGWTLPVENANPSREEIHEQETFEMLQRHKREISELTKRHDQETKIGEPRKASIIKENPKPRKTPRVVKFLDTDEVQKRILDNDEAHTAKRICTRQVDDGVGALVPPSAVVVVPPSLVSLDTWAFLHFYDGKRIPVTTNPFRIGRDETVNEHSFHNADQTTKQRVSRNHCSISRSDKEGNVMLYDTSTNGTWMGDIRIEKNTNTELCDGSIVHLHKREGVVSSLSTSFTFELNTS